MARSYAWSLRFESGAPEPRGLSREGRDGYEYARELARNADDASSYFRLPTNRVVEIGTQVIV